MRSTRSVSSREIGFRKALWRLGARGYRVGIDLPGRPDIYFPRSHLAVFVHGCYWHRCPQCSLALPKANRAFWAAKFRENLERDARVVRTLRELGVEVEIVWEHEIRTDLNKRAHQLLKLAQMLGSPSHLDRAGHRSFEAPGQGAPSRPRGDS